MALYYTKSVFMFSVQLKYLSSIASNLLALVLGIMHES